MWTIRATCDGTGIAARFDASGSVATDSTGHRTIRKITAAGVLSSPTGVRLFGTSLDFGSNNGELLITNLPSTDLAKQLAASGRISSRNALTQSSGITQQEQDLTVMATGLSGEAHYDDVAWTLDNSFNFGAKTLGSDASFTYYRLNASRVDSLSQVFQLVTRLGAQYSFDEQLPSSEQFQAGGLFSVRGYSEALLTGRNGYAASAELRALVYSPPPQQGTGLRPAVQVITFIDHGAAFPYGYSQGTNTDHYLTSAGTG